MSDSRRRRQTADAPQGGPPRDLYDEFDDLPHQPRLTQPITNELETIDSEASDAVHTWLAEDTGPPSPDDVLDVLDETNIQLAMYASLGDCIIRDAGPDYERISMLRNDYQVHHIDGGRFARHYVARKSVGDWLAEYFGHVEPIYQFVAISLIHETETDIWHHADRVGLEVDR